MGVWDGCPTLAGSRVFLAGMNARRLDLMHPGECAGTRLLMHGSAISERDSGHSREPPYKATRSWKKRVQLRLGLYPSAERHQEVEIHDSIRRLNARDDYCRFAVENRAAQILILRAEAEIEAHASALRFRHGLLVAAEQRVGAAHRRVFHLRRELGELLEDTRALLRLH